MKLKKIISELVSLALIVFVVFAFKSSFIANYTVPTGSMKPTIEPGDKLIVNKMSYNFRVPFTKISLYEFGKPQRGQVIVFECPYDPSITFVKRLVGLPGDDIEVENGLIKINGTPLELSIKNESELSDIISSGGLYYEVLGDKNHIVRRVPRFPKVPYVHVKVPENSYFAMGDNRDESADSRSWGFVPAENIWGEAKFIYFSFEWPKIRWERIGISF